MTGLGKCCSHVGAVLFYAEVAVNLRDSKTSTEEKSCWLLPGYKKVKFEPVADTDFFFWNYYSPEHEEASCKIWCSYK